MVPAEEVQDDNPQEHGKCAPISKYKRRSGACSQKGTKFEIKMAALVNLRAKRLLESYKLSINDDLAGNFDDIVLVYSSGSKKRELLVQLKHRDSNITKAALASSSGDFSLNKMFSSVKSRFISPAASASSTAADNPKDTVCVLFTNSAVNLGTSQCVNNIDPLVTDLLCTSDTDSILEVNINDEVCTTFKEQPGAKEFVKNFFIFSSQADVDHLDEIIKQEFIKFTFRIIPNYREIGYLSSIETYWDMRGKVPYLTETWEKWSSVQNLLTGNDTLLPHIRFDEQVLNDLAQKLCDPNHQKINVVCSDSNVLLTSMKVNQALVKFRNQRHLFASIDDQEKNLNIVLKLWESNSYDILIIGWDSSIPTNKLEIDENIFVKKQKKLILISDGRKSISDIFTEELVDSWYDLNEPFRFVQLDKSSQKTVLSQPINLQGIEVKLDDVGVRKELVESLMSFLNCGNIQLGCRLEVPCKMYITRTLYKQVVIKKDILGVAEIPNKVSVMGVTNENLRREIKKVKQSKDLDNFPETANVDFCSQDSVNPIHTLEMKDDMLFWRSSSGDPNYLYQFVNATDGEIEDVKHFIEHCKTSNPKDDVLVTAPLRKVIVTGEPGIGKSDLFLHIAHKLKGLYPAFWVILLNLEDVAKHMNEKENCSVNEESVLRMLAFTTGVQESPVAKKFLEEAIKYNGKIFILCDGFDEIYPNYCELVLKVLTILETKVRGLWVSSRQAVVDKLETCLQAKAFSLEPFTKDEVLRYLTDKYGWSDANKIIELIQKSTSDGTNPVSSSPLHLMMICDLIDSDRFPTNGKMLNLYEMYRSFIDIKLEKYLNNTVKDTHLQMRRIFADAFMQSHMIYSIIALDILNELQEDQCRNILNDFKKYSETVVGGHEKTGIIDGLSEDGRPRFVHRTFAEYFAALWLKKNKDISLKYIGKMTFDTHQNVLRAVFNRLLAKDCPLHLAVLDNDISDLRGKLKENPDLNCEDAGGRTLLHLASLCDNKAAVEMMKVLLYYQPKLELRDKLLNSTPLYYAVKAELWDGVRLLLQHGAHVENSTIERSYVTDLKEKLLRYENSGFTLNLDLEFEIDWPIFYEYKTILHLAAISGIEDCIKMLLENGANVEMRDVNGNTALHDAVSKGKTTAANLLLDKGACFTAVNKFGDTPLHMALRLGYKSDTSTVLLLLNLGARTDVKNQEGDTPLHDGVRYGNEFLVKLLLTYGASVMLQNKDGNTPLHLAVNRNSSENELIVELLLNSGAVTAAVNKNGDTPLHIAIQKRNFRMVRTLLRYKASVTKKNKHGDTPLHAAAREPNESIIKLLFRNGARPNVKNKNGNTPLHAAVGYDNLNVVRLLLKEHASTKIQNNNGETPLHAAVKELHTHIVELLLKYKASATDVNKEQDTPLHIAAKYSNPGTVELLLRYGAKTDAVNKDGDTPLHVAIGFRNRFNEYGAAVVAQLLGKDKRCVLICNNVGNTPLHIAVEKRNDRIVKLLLENGVNVNVTNRHGDTPLSIAEKFGHKEIVTLLQDYVK